MTATGIESLATDRVAVDVVGVPLRHDRVAILVAVPVGKQRVAGPTRLANRRKADTVPRPAANSVNAIAGPVVKSVSGDRRAVRRSVTSRDDGVTFTLFTIRPDRIPWRRALVDGRDTAALARPQTYAMKPIPGRRAELHTEDTHAFAVHADAADAHAASPATSDAEDGVHITEAGARCFEGGAVR